jgi:hypothetical protein
VVILAGIATTVLICKRKSNQRNQNDKPHGVVVVRQSQTLPGIPPDRTAATSAHHDTAGTATEGLYESYDAADLQENHYAAAKAAPTHRSNKTKAPSAKSTGHVEGQYMAPLTMNPMVCCLH